MDIPGKEKIKTPSLEERIKSGGISFREAKREQEQNYGEVVSHVEVPGSPEKEEWEINIGGKTQFFRGIGAIGKIKKWADENDGVIVSIDKKTGKLDVLAGKLVDDIFLRKAAEDEAKADSAEGFGD